MFSRVLVPLDGSLPANAALQVGRNLAERWDAELQVLSLVRKNQDPSGIAHIIGQQVARIRMKAKVDVRSLSYSIAEDIAGEFDSVDSTFVVMSSWARGRSAALVSNVAEEVFRLVRQPMLLTGPDVEISSDWPIGPVYIAVDGSNFSEAVVRSAGWLAKSLSVEIRLLTVVDPSAVPVAVTPAAETNTIGRLASNLEAIIGREVNYDVLYGSAPAASIVDYAGRHGASMIAMSTHVRSGAARLTRGSVAMDVVSHAHCPVLIDRPPIDD